MSVDGTWDITVKTPVGDQKSTVELKAEGSTLTGSWTAMGQSDDIYDGTADGDAVAWKVDVTVPMPMTIEMSGTVDGDAISGKTQAGAFPPAPFTGVRVR